VVFKINKQAKQLKKDRRPSGLTYTVKYEKLVSGSVSA
jgi:hypothetical protein